jgi:hypothetical protein
MPYKLLSKSKYLSGLQCPKYLWIQVNEPERIPETDPVTQYIFDQSHLVGELAKRLFPGGIDIPTDDFMGNIRQTEELLEQRKPLFEAGILAESIYSRVDILSPSNENSWDLIEVKSTTSVKDVHLDDVSFQKHCCEMLGLKIEKCFLMHINNQYVKEGEIDPQKFFTLQDITGEVEERSNGIQDRIADMLEVISAPICPDVTIGKHCSDPYDCALNECWEFLPEYSVFKLYYGGKKSFDLFSNGIITISEIPESYKLNDKQRIQQACEISGKPHVDREGISNFLGTLQYPLYYLDFETVGPAVPLFDGTRPYQAIPFQFSLRVAENGGANPKHFSFLASGTGDFRPTFLAELKNVLGDTGSVVVYNQGFEEGILKELALAFPEYGGWVNRVRERLVDLLSPFRQFHYYNPLQKGSASLKSVLPALTGKGYEDLVISDGQAASIAFQAVTYGNVSEEERNKVRLDLEKYCGLDTEGMIWIVDSLRDKLIE